MDSGTNSSARGGGPGLPRHSFVEDPFFHNSPFPQDDVSDVFNDFRNSTRRPAGFGGSNPRLFQDDFFDNFGSNSGGFGTEPTFFRSSLPRRAPPAGGGFDSRPVNNMQRQQTTPQRSPNQQRKNPIPAEYSHLPNGQPPPVHHQRQSSSNSHYGGNQPPSNANNIHVIPVQHQQSQQSPIQKNIVEINNADPNSYTNGQLNPDKRRRFSNNSPQGQNESQAANSVKVPIVRVDDYSNRNGEREPGSLSPAISEQAIPLPPPPALVQAENSASTNDEEGSDEVKQVDAEKDTKRIVPKNFVPIANCTEKLVHLLDETERRVEQLREAASQLEQEKEAVLDILNNVKLSADMLKLEQSEEDEVNIMADHILKRCRAVDVVVNTPRNEDQTRALDEVNQLIQLAVIKMQDDLEATRIAVQRFLNACSPDEPSGPIDERFQAKVVACTADDQKKIRRKLTQLISQIERAEKVCQPVA